MFDYSRTVSLQVWHVYPRPRVIEDPLVHVNIHRLMTFEVFEQMVRATIPVPSWVPDVQFYYNNFSVDHWNWRFVRNRLFYPKDTPQMDVMIFENMI